MKNELTYASFFATVAELQSIEEVFAGVEESQMILAPKHFPTANLTKKIAELRELLRETSTPNTDNYEIEINLLDDLDSWRTSLLQRDQAFTAFDLRSYCSNLQPQFDNSVYADLAGFYRLLPPSVTALSKFDFVITQFFSRQLGNNRRAVRFESKKIVEELNHFNIKWTGAEFDPKPIKSQIHKALVTLSKLSAQAKSHKTLRSWLENEFFDYSREVKRGLSETFFVPEVTTAIIICNLVVGNHFSSLCETDSAVKIETLPIVGSDKDTESFAMPKPPFQSLFYSSLDDDFAEAMEHERLSNLYNSQNRESEKENSLPINEKSLNTDKVVSVKQAEVSDEAVSVDKPTVLTDSPGSQNFDDSNLEKHLSVLPDNLNETDSSSVQVTSIGSAIETDKNGISGTAEKNKDLKVGTVLAQLSDISPDRELIRDYLQQSVAAQIRNLNLDGFLDAEQNSEDKYITEALRLIIRAEEATRIVISAEGSLSRKFQDEVARLLEEVQTASNILRRLMSETVSARGEDESPQKYFETMLYATNTLVEAQLRLNSALVRWQNREEIRLSEKNKKNEQNKTSDEEIFVENSIDKLTPDKFTPQVRSQTAFIANNIPNKWLLSAVLAVALLGIAWFTFYPKTLATSANSANVQVIDPKLMIGGNSLIKAKVSKNTLFGFVNSEWGAQTPQQKKDNLRALLEEGTKYGYNNVLLINQNGAVVGNAAGTETNIQ